MLKITYSICCGMDAHKPSKVACIVTTNDHKNSAKEIQTDVDKGMCIQQAEKLRIIRSHTDSLELCELSLGLLFYPLQRTILRKSILS